MKRLIKNSEFFAADELRGIYYECFKNPNSSEWQEIENLNKGIRGIITNTGNLYIWSASLLHNTAIDFFKTSKGVNIENGVHFDSSSKNSIDLWIITSIDSKYIQEAFKNAESLYGYFSKNTRISYINTTFYKSKKEPMYDEVKTIQDIIDYKFDTNNTENKNDDLQEKEKNEEKVLMKVNKINNLRKRLSEINKKAEVKYETDKKFNEYIQDMDEKQKNIEDEKFLNYLQKKYDKIKNDVNYFDRDFYLNSLLEQINELKKKLNL